jgi:hypothetical protein
MPTKIQAGPHQILSILFLTMGNGTANIPRNIPNEENSNSLKIMKLERKYPLNKPGIKFAIYWL